MNNYKAKADQWAELEGWGRGSTVACILELRDRVMALEAHGQASSHKQEALPVLTPGYIDFEHTGQDREILDAFYRACNSEGGTADEIHLRGIRAVLERWGAK
jgi:hypothetical protein